MNIPDRLRAWLDNGGYVEQSPEDWFIMNTGSSEIAIDCRGDDLPIVGVVIKGDICENDTGIDDKLNDLRNKVHSFYKNKSAGDGMILRKEMIPEPAPEKSLAEELKPEPNQWQCNHCKQPVSKKQADDTATSHLQVLCKRCVEELRKPAPKETEVVTPARVHQPNAIVPAKKEEVTLTIDVIKQYLCPNATDAEAYNFLQLCLARGLNPFLKEAYLIKYGNGAASMVVGKDAFTRKAEASPEFDGYEAGVVIESDGKLEDRIGTILRKGEELVGGWAKVYRKKATKPFEVRVSLAEYDKKMNNWKTMPCTMIRKVALVQALREAFTAELGGCYDRSEMGVDDVETPAQEVR